MTNQNLFLLKTLPGDTFHVVAEKAKQIALVNNVTVEFGFNEVKCLVNKDTNLEWLYRDYSNSWTMEWKIVGPDCLPVYEPEVQAELERRKKIEQDRIAKQEAEYRARDKRERLAFEAKVAGVEIKLKDVDGWNKFKEVNSKDGYSKCVVDYAEGWAKLMQIELKKGKFINEIAKETSHQLGFLGITGFMYGCAVSVLSQVWKHGEELRKWHNGEYGVSEDAKGVVNPAILTISSE